MKKLCQYYHTSLHFFVLVVFGSIKKLDPCPIPINRLLGFLFETTVFFLNKL